MANSKTQQLADKILEAEKVVNDLAVLTVQAGRENNVTDNGIIQGLEHVANIAHCILEYHKFAEQKARQYGRVEMLGDPGDDEIRDK